MSLHHAYMPSPFVVSLFSDVVAGRRIGVLIFGAILHRGLGRSFAIFFGGLTESDRHHALYFVHARSTFPRPGCLLLGATQFAALTPAPGKPGFGYLSNYTNGHKCYIVMLCQEDQAALYPAPPAAAAAPLTSAPASPTATEVKRVAVAVAATEEEEDPEQPGAPSPTAEAKEFKAAAPLPLQVKISVPVPTFFAPDESPNIDISPRVQARSPEEMRIISKQEIDSLFNGPRSIDDLVARLRVTMGEQKQQRPPRYYIFGAPPPPAKKTAYQMLEILMCQRRMITLEAVKAIAAAELREAVGRRSRPAHPIVELDSGVAFAIHRAACQLVSTLLVEKQADLGRLIGAVFQFLVRTQQRDKYAEACATVVTWTPKSVCSSEGSTMFTNFLNAALGPGWVTFLPE